MTPKIIITDTHFGRKNNSAAFLKSQMTFFDSLIKKINSIPTGTRFDVVHCGDVFDSRSTVSIYIMTAVMDMFRKMISVIANVNPDNRLIFIAGNHDFFSPVGDAVNSLDTIISQLSYEGKVLTISRSAMRDPEDDTILYIPWFEWNERLDDMCFDGVRLVFTHTDLNIYKYDKRIPEGLVVVSGHIHQERDYRDGRMVNLPAPYGLDFNDVNDTDKGAFLAADSQDKKNIVVTPWMKNDTSIMFRKLVGREIFDIPDLDESIERGDNYNIYLPSDLMGDQDVMSRINELREDFKYINIIPVSGSMQDICESHFDCSLDIDGILRESLPEHLRGRFDVVIEDVKKKL